MLINLFNDGVAAKQSFVVLETKRKNILIERFCYFNLIYFKSPSEIYFEVY